jgi:uncharacterized membrane protein
VSPAWRIAAAATFAMLALQWRWAFGAPRSGHFLAWSILLSLPLLPPALAFLLRRRRAPLWAGIAALLYFCLGVSGVRVVGGAWAWAEILLSLVIVFAAGWPGIAAKLARRRAPPPPNV